ncbi:MAG: hypothetical protein JW797_18790 [Bradymonadales bacterium]|nr:hypothetical protein [Bradymonadales bacterium]
MSSFASPVFLLVTVMAFIGCGGGQGLSAGPVDQVVDEDGTVHDGPGDPVEIDDPDEPEDSLTPDGPMDQEGEEMSLPDSPCDAPEDTAQELVDGLPEDTPEDGQSTDLCEEYGAPSVVGRIETDLIDEASGLAASRKNPGVLWTHNDSGGEAELFALTTCGTLLGVVELAGVEAIDWEDLAIGACGDEDCLFVGDIGNNSLERTDLSLYRLVEPAVDPTTPFDRLQLSDWQRFGFTYPEGNFDSEALVVDPAGTPYLLTKVSYGESRLYRFPELVEDEPLVLVDVGPIKVGATTMSLATAADLDRTGSRLIVRTYLNALEWRFDPQEAVESIVGTSGIPVPIHFEVQGEAISYDPREGGYFQVSEGVHPTIYRVGCRR